MPITYDDTSYFHFSNEDNWDSEKLSNLPKIAQFQNGGRSNQLEEPGIFTPQPSGEHEAASFSTPVLSPLPGKADSPQFIKGPSF